MKRISMILLALLMLFVPMSVISAEEEAQEDDVMDISVFAGVGLPTVGGVQMRFNILDGPFLPAITLEAYGGTYFGMPYVTATDSDNSEESLGFSEYYGNPSGELEVGMDSFFGISSKTFWYVLDLGDMQIPLGTGLYYEGGKSNTGSADYYKYSTGGISLEAELFMDSLPIIPYAHIGFATSTATVSGTNITSTSGDSWFDSALTESGLDPDSYTNNWTSFKWEWMPVSFQIGARYQLDLDPLKEALAKKDETEESSEPTEPRTSFRDWETGLYVAGPFPTEIGTTLIQGPLAADLFIAADYGQFFSTSLVSDVQAVWDEFYPEYTTFPIAMGLNLRYAMFEVGEVGDSLHIPIWLGVGGEFGWGFTGKGSELGGMFIDVKALFGADFEIAAIPWMIPFVNFGYGFGVGLAGVGDLDLTSVIDDPEDYLGLTAFTPYTLQAGIRIPMPGLFGSGEKKEKEEVVVEAEPAGGVYELPEWLLSSNWHRNPTNMTSQAWSFDRKGRHIKYQSNWKEDSRAAFKYQEASLVEVLNATDTEYSVKVRNEDGVEETLNFVFTEDDPDALTIGKVTIEMEGPYLILNGEEVYGKL